MSLRVMCLHRRHFCGVRQTSPACREPLLQFRERLTQLRELYVRTLGIEGEMHPWPLRPTPVFLAITPYREIFEAVSNWRKAPPPGLEEGEMLLTCMANSRLYEYYVLTALLDAFSANGSCRRRLKI